MSGRMKRRFEFTVVTLAVGFLVVGALRFSEAALQFGDRSLPHGIGAVAISFLALLFGWALADLFSGLVHFLADNFGRPTTPVIGPLLIAPFREHHQSPETMLRHGFLERNANNAMVTLPLLLWIPWAELRGPISLAWAALCLQLSIWVLLTNEIHAQCHLRPPSGAVRWLQSRGLILAPEQHDIHHTASTAAQAISELGEERFHYCITSGVCDRVARRIARFVRGTRWPRPSSPWPSGEREHP